MTKHHAELANEVTALRESFHDLSGRVAEATRSLEQSGRPPDEDTLARMQEARKRFLELRDGALSSAAAAQVSSIPSLSEIVSLEEIQKLVQAIAQNCTERENREQRLNVLKSARAVLEKVLKIAHREGREFGPLQECQKKAAELREASQAGTDGIDLAGYEDLAQGRHPYCDLLAMIEDRDNLDDQHWEDLETNLTRVFGKKMTTAIARGKLVMPLPAPPPSPAPAASEPEPAAARDGRQTAPNHTPEETAPPREKDASVEDGQKDAEDLEGRGADTLLDMQLSMEGEPIAGIDSSTLRRALPDDVWRRSPLTSEQEAALLEPSSGVTVLFGSRIAGLDEVERFLEIASNHARLITMDVAADRGGYLRELDNLLQDRPDGMIVVIVPALCPWSEDWVLRSLEHVKRKASLKKLTRVLFIADPEATWSWVRMDDDLRAKLRKEGVCELSLTPWTNEALQAWVEDAGLADRDPYIRDRISRVTGNWGELIQSIGERCQENPEDWQEHLADFERDLTSRMEWEDRLGLVDQAQVVLRSMAQMTQPVSAESIAGRMENTPRERVDTVLRWSSLLSYVRPATHYEWTLDSVVRQVVLQQAQAQSR